MITVIFLQIRSRFTHSILHLIHPNVTIPFVDRFPKGEIYNLLTTRPEDIAHAK